MHYNFRNILYRVVQNGPSVRPKARRTLAKPPITWGNASGAGEENSRTSLGLTNQPQKFSTQESQGPEQRCRHRPEQERKINLEGPPGETRLHQDPRGDQVHQGPPLNTGAQGETKEVRTALGSAQGRDGTRHRVTDGARP